MKRGKVGKRGIAPLVATILLISFAVAVGVVIMSFGSAQVELEAQCPVDIGLKMANIGGQDEMCYDGSNIKFTLENGVNIEVSGLIVNVIGSNEAKTFTVNEAKMEKLGNYLGSVAYDKSSSGEIRQVKITPKIDLNGNEEICLEKVLIVENVRGC